MSAQEKNLIRIACAQLNPVIGDFAGNLAKAREAVESSDADLVVFPELYLAGYYPCDLLDRPGFVEAQAEALGELIELSRAWPRAVAMGVVEPNEGPGRPWRNSLLLIEGGQVIARASKMLLPTYDVFDERRHFEPAGEPTLALWRGVKLGLLICEDGWNHGERGYAADPVQILADRGAELIVYANASPSSLGKAERREALFGRASRDLGVAQVYANQVGGQDEIVFDGASFAIGADGAVCRMPQFAEAVGTFVYDRASRAFAPGQGASREPIPASREAFELRQVEMGIADYFAKNGIKGAVVGCSGGIDSGVVLAFAARALGPQNVKAIGMPSAYSSEGSVSDSVELCRRLGVELIIHPIAEMVAAEQRQFEKSFGEPMRRLALENLQARIRGQVLMAYSNHFGHLVLSTGNKSEMSVGYATLYGDMNGGLNPLGDFYKMEVYAMARHLNEISPQNPPIPEAIIEKAPSAELFPGQQDSDSLPAYPLLDAALRLCVEAGEQDPREREADIDLLRSAGFGREQMQRVLSLLDRAEFKRKQAPPIIRLRSRAFGFGRRVPVSHRHAPDAGFFLPGA